MSAPGSLGDFEDWRRGRSIDRCCLKKVVCGAGLTSYAGDAESHFALLRRLLERRRGFDRDDLLEATYAGYESAGEWWPKAYHVTDVQASIDSAIHALAGELKWYRSRLPASRFYLVGYSLGGVIAFETAGLLLSRDLRGWRERLAGIAMLASPLLGVDFGPLRNLAETLAARPDFFGQSGLDLVKRARDPSTIDHVESTAELLRTSGATLLAIVDRNDAVVLPSDAIPPSFRQYREAIEVAATVPAGADETARRFGHGSILRDLTAITAVEAMIGPQECLGSHRRTARSSDDPVEDELESLRARMRGESE